MVTSPNVTPRDGPGGPFFAVGLAVAVPVFAFPLPLVSKIGALIVYALILLCLRVALSRAPQHHFGHADTITLFRAGGAAVFAGLAFAPDLLAGPAAAWTAAVAVVLLLALDGLDGFVARGEGVASDFGARFDMETDAFTILVLSVLAFVLGKAGVWVLALGLMRYAFVAAGLLQPRLARPLPPSLRRKAVCVAQVAVLAALLAPVITPPLSVALAAAALAALVWSFAVDLRWLMRAAP